MNDKNDSSPRGPMIVMIAGTLAIAGLVAWALTRTVEPAPLPSAATIETPAQSPALTPAPLTPPPLSTTTGIRPTPTPIPVPLQTTTSLPPQFTPRVNDETAGVRRIGPAELKKLVDRGAVTVIDVRDSLSYNQGHIPGAIHVPMARVQGEVSSFPKGKPVVAYCT